MNRAYDYYQIVLKFEGILGTGIGKTCKILVPWAKVAISNGLVGFVTERLNVAISDNITIKEKHPTCLILTNRSRIGRMHL